MNASYAYRIAGVINVCHNCIKQKDKKRQKRSTTIAKEMSTWNRGVRFERLTHIAATGARIGDFAAALDFKSGYFAVGCGPTRFMAFKARVRLSWLLELCGDDAEKAARVLAAEGQIQPKPVSKDHNPWVEVTLAWVAMIMGLRTAADQSIISYCTSS